MKSVFAGNGLRQSSAVENGNECCGIWIRNSRPTGQVEVFVSKPSHSLRPKIRKRLRAHAICAREIFLAYVCILLIDSACLFPAVWMRSAHDIRTDPLRIHRSPA